MSSHCYRIHGLDIATNIVAPIWPASPEHAVGASCAPWRVEVETNSADVAREVTPRSGPAQWHWRDTAGYSALAINGTPPGWDPGVATAAHFLVDFDARSIRARHSHADEDGCMDLLTRWVLPDVARAELDLLPLHASAVETPAGALLLLGDSGRGKSTLTAALLACGAKFLGDEPICIGPQGAWPGPTALRIDPGAAAKLLGVSGPADAAGKALLGYEIDASAARPLAGLVRLAPRRSTGELVQWELPRSPIALQALMELRYGRIRKIDNVTGDFRRAATLLGSVPILSVSVLDNLEVVVEAAAELIDVVAALG